MIGSPPPAWGKPGVSQGPAGADGFTPTRVGKAGSARSPQRREPVHPHPRGESVADRAIAAEEIGSPPPAWGKLMGVNDTESTGFTPTRVGKATSTARSTAWTTVHPHPRGESPKTRRASSSVIGSPPPAWGKRQVQPIAQEPSRFTPTRVGKAPSPNPRVHPHPRQDMLQGGSRVHPHPRGESPIWPIMIIETWTLPAAPMVLSGHAISFHRHSPQP